MKKYVHSAVLGVTVGLIISLITSGIFAKGYYTPINPFSTMGAYYIAHFNQWTIMVISVLIWAAIGLLFALLDKIYYQDWSLLRMSITHFATSLLGFTPLAILAGWFPLTLSWIVIFFPIFILIYVTIYWANYQHMRKSISDINHSLGK